MYALKKSFPPKFVSSFVIFFRVSDFCILYSGNMYCLPYLFSLFLQNLLFVLLTDGSGVQTAKLSGPCKVGACPNFSPNRTSTFFSSKSQPNIFEIQLYTVFVKHGQLYLSRPAECISHGWCRVGKVVQTVLQTEQTHFSQVSLNPINVCDGMTECIVNNYKNMCNTCFENKTRHSLDLEIHANVNMLPFWTFLK